MFETGTLVITLIILLLLLVDYLINSNRSWGENPRLKIKRNNSFQFRNEL